MPKKYNLDDANLLFNETFRESQRDAMKHFIKSIVDTEDYSGFSRYTKNLVIEYMLAFMTRLVSQIWASYASTDTTPEKFFTKISGSLSRQLNKVKQALLDKNCLSDVMLDPQIILQLDRFFKEYEDRSEYSKAQAEYIDLKQDFLDIEELVKGLYSTGEELIEHSQFLLEKYLKHKETVLKKMGYDVALDYQGIDNFSFLYRDARLADPKVRAEVEAQAMNQALKALMPSFRGDISAFAKICENIK